MHELSLQILSYLADNPEANDTVEGIEQWWLLEQRILEERTRVERALSELAAAGLIAASRGADGRTRYRLADGRGPQVRELLAERETGG